MVLRLPSNRLCYLEVVAEIFSVTRASGVSFEIVDEKHIEELKNKSENENTKKSTEYWKNVFKKWANEQISKQIYSEYECDVRDQALSQFYKHSEIQ